MIEGKLDILGTEYRVQIVKFDECELLKKYDFDGFCDADSKKIYIADVDGLDEFRKERGKESVINHVDSTLRHEIVHAYLSESGLEGCTSKLPFGWAVHEEMIDWIALQGPKMARTWEVARKRFIEPYQEALMKEDKTVKESIQHALSELENHEREVNAEIIEEAKEKYSLANDPSSHDDISITQNTPKTYEEVVQRYNEEMKKRKKNSTDYSGYLTERNT